jgi:threonine dehydrogenase-like Zn-dependent dehydrogenase
MKEVSIPEPGHGQVLIKTKSSTICGSDIRAIIVSIWAKDLKHIKTKLLVTSLQDKSSREGPGLKRFKKGDRVVLYHISGCGCCNDCRRGYMISCTSDSRAAYGWQRDGGMAEYIIADEKDCVLLPDELTYTDGAQIACGFGTVYEGLEKIGICGNDAVLIVGLGPVGLATLMLAKAMGASKLIGVDVVKERCQIAIDKGLADHVFVSGDDTLEKIKELTDGMDVNAPLILQEIRTVVSWRFAARGNGEKW